MTRAKCWMRMGIQCGAVQCEWKWLRIVIITGFIIVSALFSFIVGFDILLAIYLF